MKKECVKIISIIMMAIFLIAMTACGNQTKDERSLETFKSAFEAAGVTLENEDEPLFGLIDAKDGVMFYNGTQVVKIYEYEDEASLEKAIDKFGTIGSWPRNGKFVLETSNEQAIEIFNGVAQ